MKKNSLRALAGVFVLGCTLHVTAAPIFTLGTTVTSADRTASFSSLTANGISLSAYTEGSLSITDSAVTYQGFSAFAPGDSRTTGFWYPSSGNNNYARIVGTDGATFTAIDFLIGNGQGGNTTNLRWYTLLNNVVTGTGLESGLTKGQIVGWTDVGGFDELRVAAAISSSDPGFGSHQSIAIDDLRAQINAVPEPASLALLGLGLAGLGFARRRTKPN